MKQKELYIRDIKDFLKKVGRTPTKEGIVSLAAKYGSPVNLNEEGSVGFIASAKFWGRLAPHFARIQVHKNNYILWTKNNVNYRTFEVFAPGPVYVAGSLETGLASRSIPVLISVGEDELRSACDINGSGNRPEGTVVIDSSRLRTWTDQSGKFKVDAKLVEFNGQEVVLKTKTGKTIRVPQSKLSNADLNYIKQQ